MVGVSGPAAILYGDLEQLTTWGRRSEAGFGDTGVGRLLAYRAGGVILLRARMEVGRERRLSRFVR